MNIIISGYGKMGREVEAVALTRGHQILARFDHPDHWDHLETLAANDPMVVDFSQPAVVEQNILRCFRHHVPVVVGTTGWNHNLPALIETCRNGNHTLLTASNFSIGMNIFFAVNKFLAAMMDHQTGYGVGIRETHHLHKLDKPSGTAITLADQIIQNIRRKTEWTAGSGAENQKLTIDSVREGEVFGNHEVCYDSAEDRIVIGHSAKNRKGFALGAVQAAEWLKGRTGYFEMTDFLGI